LRSRLWINFLDVGAVKGEAPLCQYRRVTAKRPRERMGSLGKNKSITLFDNA